MVNQDQDNKRTQECRKELGPDKKHTATKDGGGAGRWNKTCGRNVRCCIISQ